MVRKINLSKSNSAINLNKKDKLPQKEESKKPWKFPGLPEIADEVRKDLVPIGGQFYISPNRAVDPRDCDNWFDSPWCGGLPNRDMFSYEPSLLADECNFGIQLGGRLGGWSMPPLQLVWRKEGCTPPQKPVPQSSSNKFKPLRIDNLKDSEKYLVFVGSDFFESSFAKLGAKDQISVVTKAGSEGINFERYTKEYSDFLKIQHINYYGLDPFGPYARNQEYWGSCEGVFSVQKQVLTGNVEGFAGNFYSHGEWWNLNPYLWRTGRITNNSCNTISAMDYQLNLLGYGTLWERYSPSLKMPLVLPQLNIWMIYGNGQQINDFLLRFAGFRQEVALWTGDLRVLEVKYKILEVLEDSTNSSLFKPPPPLPPTRKPPMNCCPQTNNKLAALMKEIEELKKRVGVNDFPVTVPKSISDGEGTEGGTEKIESIPQLQVWSDKQLHSVLGQFTQEIEIEDVDLIQKGNQKLKISLPNIAETLSELITLVIDLQTTNAALINLASRNLIETGLTKKEAIEGLYYAKANAEYLGYEGKEISKKVPYLFDLKRKITKAGVQSDINNLAEFLSNSQETLKLWEMKQTTDLGDRLSTLEIAANVILAVYTRQLNIKGDIKSQLKQMTKTDEATSNLAEQASFNDLKKGLENS